MSPIINSTYLDRFNSLLDNVTNYFTYLKKQDGYQQSYNKLKSIIRTHFHDLGGYDLIEDALIECMLPAIYYFHEQRLANGICSVLYTFWRRSPFFGFKELENKIDEVMLDVISDIEKVKHDYKYLRYFNESNINIIEFEGFEEDVYIFLKKINVWTIKTKEEDPAGYMWQIEWDIEFFEILNIAYHLNDLEEINDVYNLVWMMWVNQIHVKRIHPDARKIWKNIAKWRKMMDKRLIQ